MYLNAICVVLYGSKGTDRSTFFFIGSATTLHTKRFYTPIQLQKIAFNFINIPPIHI